MNGNANGLLATARGRVAGSNPNAVVARLREERLRWLAETFPDLTEMSLIDLGGRLRTWQRAPIRPKRVHVVNLETAPEDLPDWAEYDHGDACELPAHITSRRYDLVFSNSVIEHVGGHERRLRFAESVYQLADAYWVQTPYRYFLIEPHWLAPGMQFLPVTTRAALAQHWPVQFWRANDRQEALRRVLSVELLDRTMLRYYFPDAALLTEKFLGMTKSLIAYRAGSGLNGHA